MWVNHRWAGDNHYADLAADGLCHNSLLRQYEIVGALKELSFA